jgi:hypothetical protein
MKAVFSFWSKPFKRSLHKSFAGFPNQEYFATSFKLALLTAKKNFETTQLVTDTEGYQMLVVEMGLEFDEVSLALNDIADIPANLWAFGKLHAYGIQTGPFVHLDFDMFFLRPIPDAVKTAAILTQSTETFDKYDFYRWGVHWILATHKNLPMEFAVTKSIPYHNQLAYNAGLMGGNNWKALADYAQKAQKFVRDNLAIIEALPDFRISEANVCYEQYFLWAYVTFHKIKVDCYIDDIADNDELQQKGFVHLLAGNKSDLKNCDGFTKTYEKFLDKTSVFYY